MQLDQAWVMQQGEDAMLLHFVDTAFSFHEPRKIAVAVSGGGDSMALLHVFSRWARQTGQAIEAVTVDHGLRAESAEEAAFVGAQCHALGLHHHVLHWDGGAGSGNLAARAREGRYALMAQWARERGVDAIALGHTQDDNAENFLMRLSRAAGVDGLAAMEPRFERHGLWWSRPFWQQSRAHLRDYLRRHEVPWVEDPSNDNPASQRTKARKALAVLADLGIGAEQIHQSSFALRMASASLRTLAWKAACSDVVQTQGDLLFPPLHRMDTETERRLWRSAVHWFSAKPYPPRERAMQAMEYAFIQADQNTVGGCLVRRVKDGFRLTREYQAVRDVVAPTDEIWDNRWKIDGPHAPGLEVRALGDGLQSVPDWRDSGLPRASLRASPAIWQGQTLISAPLLGDNTGWSARIVTDFTSFLLSH